MKNICSVELTDLHSRQGPLIGLDIVYNQLREKGLTTAEVTLVIHAGKNYYEELLLLLADDDCEIEIPTEGLQIGNILSWYTAHT